MTSTDLALRDTGPVAGILGEKIKYAEFLADADLLPKAYQGKPANLLWAIEYGAMLGLPPMAAVVGIHIIDGRPTMSAGLMAAKVREAGHKIRVQSTGEGDGAKARCTIRRSDDPDFEYSAVWTMARARQAGLLNKTNWIRHPIQMLKNRAISEACRDACQEVLLGVHYTPDELGAADDGGEVVFDGYDVRNGMPDHSRLSEAEKDVAGLMPQDQRVSHTALRRDGEPAPGAVEKLPGTPGDDPWLTPETPAAEATAPPPPPDTAPHRQQSGKGLLDKLQAAFARLGIEPDDEKPVIAWLSGSEWTASTRQINDLIKQLDDFVSDKRAQGDLEEARSLFWQAFHKRPGAVTGDADE